MSDDGAGREKRRDERGKRAGRVRDGAGRT